MNKRNLIASLGQHLAQGLMAAIMVGTVVAAWNVQAGKASTTIRVTSFSDSVKADGACTLREAVIAANKDMGGGSGECPAGSGADTIIIPAGTYTLARTDTGKEDYSATGDLDIRSDVSIITEGGLVKINAVSGFKDRIFHVLSGNVSISGAILSGGKPAGDGGGIFNLGTLTLERSALSGNTAGGRGGGIYNAGTLTLTNATISGNNSKSGGGGLFNSSGTASLNNVTITGNKADSDANGSGDGGGISKIGGAVNLRNTLIAGNSDRSGGGSQRESVLGSAGIRTGIRVHPDCSGTYESQGYNLIQNLTGCTLTGDLTGNQSGVDPQLGPLQDNGGATLTHALLAGSPAIDAGNPAAPGSGGSSCAGIDQRGVVRPQLAACDVGAFEVEGPSDPPQNGPIFSVNTANDADDGVCSQGHCSLREAIAAANAHPNGATPDEIRFNLPGSAPFTIQPASALPGISDPVNLDGATQPGGSLALDGTSAGAGADGLVVNASNMAIRDLTIRRFGGDGIRVSGGSGVTLNGNSLSANGGLGIDLGPDGVTANDPGDGDAGPNGLQNFPVLMHAIPSGSDLVIKGRLNSAANGNYTLEFFSVPSCDASNFGEGQTSLGMTTLTTDGSGDADFNVTLATSLPSGSYITATATSPNGSTSEFSQCSTTGPANESWVQATELTLLPPSSEMSSAQVEQFIDKTGQARWYKFDVNPGNRIILTLTNLPANYDLTLYKDIAAAYQTLNSPQDLLRLGAEFSPDVFSPDNFSPDVFSPDNFSPDVFSPDNFSPDNFSPDVFSPDNFSPDVFSPDNFSPDNFSPDNFSPDNFSPDNFSPDNFSPDNFSPDNFSPEAFASAQSRSLIAVSAFEGVAGEGVVINTWDNDGDFYVRVRGRNGAFNLGAPFRLEVISMAGACRQVNPVSTPSDTQASNGGFKTIILTDFSRMEGSESDKADLATRLATFASRPEVSGVIVDVNADDRVRAANQQADNFPECPYAKNLVAFAIKDIVDRYADINPLEYVVILGNDGVIPFFRLPDQALLGNEKNYVPPVGDATTSQASLRLGYFLSQDRYGADTEIAVKANSLPLPKLAVGRLVETAAEVTGILDAYISAGGVMPTPASALVTGYDFLADGATAVKGELEAGLGQAADTLITPRGVSPEDPASWDADDLRSSLLGSPHDLIFLAGHFSASSTLAADYATRLTTADLLASPVDLLNALIFSAGCHSGYNIVNADGVQGVTQEPDWAQAFARKRAMLIAGTGYQYGDTDFIEYSERLYREFARQLRVGNGAIPVGKALVAAKQVYLEDTAQLRGIHEKALLEATLFGLPMMGINMPGQRFNPPADPSIVGSTTGFSNDPGATLGLKYADVSLSPNLTLQSVTLDVLGGSQTTNATYLSGSKGVVANPGEPVLPAEIFNVKANGTVLRGAGFRSGSYQDIQDILPLLTAATTEVRGVHAPFLATAFYPVRPWNLNYFGSLFDPVDGATRLVLTPGQFKSNAPGDARGTLRRFNQMAFRLYYSNNTTAYANGQVIPGLSASPTIARISAVPQNGNVRFAIQVVGDPAAGIQEVWVTYTGTSGPFFGTWQSLDLAQNAGDTTLWEGNLPLNGVAPQNVRFIVQAVNGVGLVALSANQGEYYIPGVETSLGLPTDLSLESPPTSGAYGTQAGFSAVLRNNGTPLASQLITFRLGSISRQATTNSAGRATVSLPLLGIPGDTLVSATFAGTVDYAPDFDSAGFTITRQDSQLVLNPATATVQYSDGPISEATLSDADGRRMGEKTVFFSASGTGGTQSVSVITDYAGRAMLEQLDLPAGDYTLKAQFSGTVVLPGQTLNLQDERYNPSMVNGSLSIAAEDATVAYTGDTSGAPGAIVHLAAAVTQATDGMLGDLTKAQVRYDVRDSTGTVVVSLTGSVAADGTSAATLDAGLPAGLYTVEVTVIGGFFTSPTASATLAINVSPDCSLAYASPASIWPPNHKFVSINILGVTHPGNLPVSITVTSIFQDEPVGRGPLSPDGKGVGTSLAKVRAERTQPGNGRVYHIRFTADDGLGGVCSGEVLVGVPLNQGGGGPVDDGALYDSTVPD